jgi:hypothetical protein
MGSLKSAPIVIGTTAALAISSLLLACVIISPALASVSDVTTTFKSNDTLAKDKSEPTDSFKNHIAYVDQLQDAQMASVISYIDNISSGQGSGNLRNIRADFLSVASSIPVMQTTDDIEEARAEVEQQSRLFSEEVKFQVQIFNGSIDVLRQQASASVQATEDSIPSLKDTLWLDRASARLTVFNRESGQRSNVIRSLGKQGVDISQAANISHQIDAQRSDLVKALIAKSPKDLKTINSRIKFLNRDFRAIVDESRVNLQIEMSRAAILAMK